MKGAAIEDQDEHGHTLTAEEFQAGINEWWPFIRSVREWRAGSFTITLTEWNELMPPILKDLLSLHDKILAEMPKRKKKA